MPFIAQCPYCNFRSRVPEHALGESGECPSCASFFTLSPAEDQGVPELAAVAADPGDSELAPVSRSSLAAAIAAAEAVGTRGSAGVPSGPVDEVEETAPASVGRFRALRLRPAAATGATALLLAALRCCALHWRGCAAS